MNRAALRTHRAPQRGQSMVEYAVITAALLGFTVLSWPYLTLMVNALDTYFRGIYYVLQSPVL